MYVCIQRKHLTKRQLNKIRPRKLTGTDIYQVIMNQQYTLNENQYSSSFQKSSSMPLSAYRACFLKMRPVLRPFIRPYMSINVLKNHF